MSLFCYISIHIKHGTDGIGPSASGIHIFYYGLV
jgi:hypothetical protein